jgi:selenocysteine lyase/cysteine desulfurase
LSKVKPTRFGGGMNSIIRPDHYTLAPSPDRFEAGTINTAGILS